MNTITSLFSTNLKASSDGSTAASTATSDVLEEESSDAQTDNVVSYGNQTAGEIVTISPQAIQALNQADMEANPDQRGTDAATLTSSATETESSSAANTENSPVANIENSAQDETVTDETEATEESSQAAAGGGASSGSSSSIEEQIADLQEQISDVQQEVSELTAKAQNDEAAAMQLEAKMSELSELQGQLLQLMQQQLS